MLYLYRNQGYQFQPLDAKFDSILFWLKDLIGSVPTPFIPVIPLCVIARSAIRPLYNLFLKF